MSETMQSTDAKARAVEEQIESVKNADSLADTPFSTLFHEARTTGRNRATGVTLQVRVRDGEFEVHDNMVKTRQGEHLRGTDAWDGMVSIPVKPFMETRTARNEIVRQLRGLAKTYRRKAQKEAQDPGALWNSQYEQSGDQ
jgi:hypothetical protein